MAPNSVRGRRLPLALLGALLPVCPLAGQQAVLRFDAPPLTLRQPIVVSLVQDRSGYMWVGTHGGLVRYDGHATVVYSGARNAEHPLPSSAVREIIEHSDGRLWVTTLNGLAILSADRRSMQVISTGTHPDLLGLTDAFSALVELPDGRVATGLDGGGVVVFTAEGAPDEVHRADPDDPEALPSGTVDDLLVGADGALWAGTLGGLVVKSPGRDVWERVPLADPSPGTDEEPRRLALAPDGTVWAGGLNGVMRIDPATRQVRATRLGPYRVQAMTITHADSVWVGTYGNGLYLLDRDARVVLSSAPRPGVPQSLLDGRVSAITRDRSGLLWVGLWGSGVQTVDPAGTRFRFLAADVDLEGEEVTSIHVRPSKGDLVLTTYSGGVNIVGADGRLRRTIDAGRVGDLNEPAEVLTALWSEDETLLVGTMRLGVQVVAPDGSRRTYGTDAGDPLSLPDAVVYDIEEDAAGRTWVGTNLGLWRFERSTGAFHPPDVPEDAAQLASAFVRNVHVAPDGWLWIATLGAGLFIHHPETGETRVLDTRRFDEIPDDEVAAVTTLGPYGWFGTRSGGTLHRVVGWESAQTLRIEQVGPAEGLGEAVQCLVADARGRLWGSTTREILGIDPGSLEVTVYGAADGVPDGEFRSAACAAGPDGKVWFGQQTGATVFDPDSLTPPSFKSTTVVASATFGTRGVTALLAGEQHTIPYRGGMVGFRMAVLDYRSPESQTFAYRLGGGPWISLGEEASVTFADLSPGRYTFEARGRDAHGFPATPSEPVVFQVMPPVWMTGWFRAAALLFAAGAIYLLFQWRTRTIRRHNAELRREIDERKRLEAQGAILEEQLRQSQKMEAVGRLTGGIAHDFNNILTVLMGNAELLLESDDHVDWRPMVDEIRSSGETAANLVRQLLVYARRQPLARTRTDLVTLLRRMQPLVQRSIGAHYDVLVDLLDDEAIVALDPNQFESALLNLAINARDAMPDGGRFRIALRRRRVVDPDEQGVPPGDWWVVTASDTGIGIPEDVIHRIFEPFFTTKDVGHGSGLGLAMVYGFVEQSGGHIRAESETGEGTRILMYLPVAG